MCLNAVPPDPIQRGDTAPHTPKKRYKEASPYSDNDETSDEPTKLGLLSDIPELPPTLSGDQENLSETYPPKLDELAKGVESLQIDEVDPPQSPLIEVQPTQSFEKDVYRSPRVSNRIGSPRRGNNKPGAELAQRARAEEINSGSKVVPKVLESPQDFLGVDIECESWFSVADVAVPRWLESLNSNIHSAVPASQWLNSVLAPENHSFRSVSEIRERLITHCIPLIDPKTFGVTKEPFSTTEANISTILSDFSAQTVLFFCLVVAIERQTRLLASGVPVLTSLLREISSLRWDMGLDDQEDEDLGAGSTKSAIWSPRRATYLPRLFLLVRMAFMATFGRSKSLSKANREVWQQYGLSMDDYDANTCASPINYASFMEDIAARYPTFLEKTGPEHELGSWLKWLSLSSKIGADLETREKGGTSRISGTTDGSPLDQRDAASLGNSFMPILPKSIIEACELYKSRVKLTPIVFQLAQELQILKSTSNENVPATPKATSTVSCVNQLYEQTLSCQKSLVHVALDFIISIRQNQTVAVYAALSTIWQMLQWFQCAHVLMFENCAALLFDCQFHVVAHLFCKTHTDVQSYILEDYSSQGFWMSVGKLETYDGVPLKTDTQPENLIIKSYNEYNLQTLVYMMDICRLITAGKTQRLLVVAELPVEPYKNLFDIYEKNMWLQMLQYLKNQIPYTGKRWRYLNMDIISAIYLHVPSEIDDRWLSGTDTSGTTKMATVEEQAIRTMIMAFNNTLSEHN